MAIPLAAVTMGLDFAGKIAGGISGSQKAREDAKQRARELAQEQQQFTANLGENQRQFNAGYGQKAFDQNLNANTAYGDRAQSVNRELETLPMRDKAQALLMQRMGAPAQQVQARSLAGGTASLAGGTQPQGMPYNLEANRQQAANYKAGDGGMTGDVQKELLSRYMDVPKTPEMEQPKTKSPAEIDYAIRLKDQELSKPYWVMEKDLFGNLRPVEKRRPRGEIDRELQLYRSQLEAGK